MDSEWIRNSIQKEGFTCTEAIIIFGDIGIVIFLGRTRTFVVHRSLLKHWKIQMFENLNRLSKSANMKMFRSSSVSAPLLSGFGRQ